MELNNHKSTLLRDISLGEKDKLFKNEIVLDDLITSSLIFVHSYLTVQKHGHFSWGGAIRQ